MSFFLPGRSSTTRRASCCSCPATGCAPNGSSVRGLADPPDRFRAGRRRPRLISDSPRCSSHHDRGSWTACSTSIRTWESPGWRGCGGATAATPEVLKAELDKLKRLRRHGADTLDLSRLPAGRRRPLAEIGRRSSNQALQRADANRRHPVLLATLAEIYVEGLDELVQRPVLRPPRPHPPSPPRRPDRAGALPDPGHQRRGALDDHLPQRRARRAPR